MRPVRSISLIALALAASLGAALAQTATPATPAAPAAPAAPSIISTTPMTSAPSGLALPPSSATPGADQGAPAAPDQQAAKPKPRPKPKPAPAPPREMAISDDPTPTFQPETFFTTAKASERYARIVDAGGWPTIPGALKPGSKGKGVSALRRRLAAEGDLEGGAGDGESWDEGLTAAVKKFQFRLGLRQTGAVAGATLKALNIPAAVRFRQLASSAQRVAGSSFGFGDRYVVVNIRRGGSGGDRERPGGRSAMWPSSAMSTIARRRSGIASISAINVNPTWTVPTSIIKNEIIPKMRQATRVICRAIASASSTGAATR
jgi:hypothetical protein